MWRAKGSDRGRECKSDGEEEYPLFGQCKLFSHYRAAFNAARCFIFHILSSPCRASTAMHVHVTELVTLTTCVFRTHLF